MNYWHILGVEKTADLRAIKRAYAARLKKTKPDEDPEGFKQLHAAYKWACQHASSAAATLTAEAAPGPMAPQAEEAAVSSQRAEGHTQAHTELSSPAMGEIYAETVPEPQVTKNYYQSATDYFQPQAQLTEATIAPVSVPVESAPYQEELEQIANADGDDEFVFLQGQWEELTARTDKVTQSIHAINDLRSWRFLNGREALFDLQFKAELSYYIFDRIVRRLSEDGQWLAVKKPVFDFLDGLFRWSDRRDLLEEQFGFGVVDSVLRASSGVDERLIKWTSPRRHKGVLVYAGYYPRIFSTLLDWFLFGFGASLLYKLAARYLDVAVGDQADWLVGGLLAYGLIAPIMEATPLQGTPGKILFNMKVVTPKGRRLNVFHAYWRALMFGFSTAMFKLTVWVNLFLRDGRLLHDRASRSIVVKR